MRRWFHENFPALIAAGMLVLYSGAALASGPDIPDRGSPSAVVLDMDIDLLNPMPLLFMIPFYDADGRAIGVLSLTQTVQRGHTVLRIPVKQSLSGAAALKVVVLDRRLRPVRPAETYRIPALPRG